MTTTHHLLIIDPAAYDEETEHLYRQHVAATPSILAKVWDEVDGIARYARTSADVAEGFQLYLKRILAPLMNLTFAIVEDRNLVHAIIGGKQPLFRHVKGSAEEIGKLMAAAYALAEHDRLKDEMWDVLALMSESFRVNDPDDLDHLWSATWDFLAGGRHYGELWP